MPTDLRNKRALVTGASRGIGLAIARALAAEGVNLFITARDDHALQRATTEFRGLGTSAEYMVTNMADQSEIEQSFSRAVEFLGGIDILINNAGYSHKAQVIHLDLEEWDQMFNVNLRAAFILSKLAAQKMIAQKFGYIINIGSGASQTPVAAQAAYCATKFGLLGFSESMALELREHNIKVSIVLPGSTATHFGGSDPREKKAAMPGILLPEDVADSVLYLLKQSRNAWTSIMNLRPLIPQKA